MLNIFRKDIWLQAVIVVLVATLLWLRALLEPPAVPFDEGGVLFMLLAGDISPRLAVIVGWLLTMAGGLMLSWMLYNKKMISHNTLMPMLFYIFAMSIGRHQTTLTPLLMASFFLIACIGQLMVTTSYLSLTIDKTFAAAALLSMATLFCPAAAVFIVPLMLCMVNYSLYSWRDWTMLILGFLAPYIILETCFLLSNRLFYENYLLWYSLIPAATWRWPASVGQWALAGGFLTVLLVVWVATASISQSRVVNFKKNTGAIAIFLIGGLLYALWQHLTPIHTQAFAIPFAFASTVYLYEEKKREWIWDIVLCALILTISITN